MKRNMKKLSLSLWKFRFLFTSSFNQSKFDVETMEERIRVSKQPSKPSFKIPTLEPKPSTSFTAEMAKPHVTHMIEKNGDNINGKTIEYFAVNTDLGALRNNKAKNKMQIGVNVTGGVGAGASPEIGRRSAEENLDDVMEQIKGFHCAFICCGLGGGTGSGSTPVIANELRDSGILTIGVVTLPFDFEGEKRKKVSMQCLEEVEKNCNSLIVVPNQNIFQFINEDTGYSDAFSIADDVLNDGVRCITDLITKPGLINLDFSDVRTVMKNGGRTFMGTGVADSDDIEAEVQNKFMRKKGKKIERSQVALIKALHNPYIKYSGIRDAENVIVSISGGDDLTLFEVENVSNLIKEKINPTTNLLIGTCLDHGLENKIKVSVVITGIPKGKEEDEEMSESNGDVMNMFADDDKNGGDGGILNWFKRNW